MKALQTIKEHFGKPIELLDTEDYDAMEKPQTYNCTILYLDYYLPFGASMLVRITY